ncbi:hypothetical protein DLAC_07980 [Tieghemostelium lacteum]|uniref:Transmembrane protein n=1 Tax=Tieghemostelium lacteum TaxID=361077 RepID=A0A151ZAV4_TIELA|nr:hypothetical protein DLAC_07980 [Tieghemostelium lacteum]|eukprot:KYQ91077.1 hypothetical protein DLAC_07980 [Tieghemostelium lacteum]
MDNPIASNIFSILGLIIWSTQMIPQIRLNFIRKSTEGVSLICFSSWVLSGLILAPYLVATNKGPALVVQISVLTTLTTVVLFQHYYYDRKVGLKKLLFWALITLIVSMGISIGIYYLMKSFSNEEFKVSLAVSVVSTFFMLAGFLPQIYEIYAYKNSEAISKVFICMDFSGASCAIISLAFIEPFDWMSFATYVVVPICEFTQFWMIIYYSRLVKTGKVEYQDETSYQPDKKPSLWKRTHRRNTVTTAGITMTKREPNQNLIVDSENP